MIKMMVKAALVFAALQCATANAALQKVHWKTEGDASVILDTTTGIEWLNLNATRGKSVSEVSLLLQNELAGWRFPTITEMRGLLLSIHGRLLNNDLEYVNSSSSTYESSARHHMFGPITNHSTTGLYQNSGGVYAYLTDSYYQNGGIYYFNHYRGASLSYTSQEAGVYLVSDGGVSWSSINDPSLNASNPNAPVNQSGGTTPAAPVSSLGLFSVAMLFLLRVKKYKKV